ncbi:hypothetical protein HA402_004453 [Bradysia odoriphaga]|nr:hypothetical protein HA402_004453 [Bradysia odoriphaga]
MAQQHKVHGYDDLIDCINRIKSDNKPINIYFTGSKDDTGKSWCPDCVEALPFVEKALTSSDPNTHFIYCDVGDRPFWKDMKNVFRLDKKTHLSVIPTLIRWDGPQRLEGEQLLNPELLSMFFSEE